MTERSLEYLPPEGGISVLGVGAVLLRWRRTIILLGIGGAALGAVSGLTTTRVYTSTATFIPQGSESAQSGLALAASQLGVRMPSSGGPWGPPVYVRLLRSRALLEPLALDTLTVAEKGGQRTTVMELFGITGGSQPERVEQSVSALQGVIDAGEARELGGVRLGVTTPWPSVSVSLATRLVDGVNRFNLETRKSQAAAEREFVEEQSLVSERALRSAEDRLQSFLLRNRETAGSPVLGFERDRLQREVLLGQELHTSWLKAREEARIREVRDIPVITVFEAPRQPTVGQPRGTVGKAIMGGISGALLGLFIALASLAISRARTSSNAEAKEFFRLVEEAKPRFLRARAG